jgi:enoyl-CoA hydratase/carnithine racemase
MGEELLETFEIVDEDEDVKGVVITGAGRGSAP